MDKNNYIVRINIFNQNDWPHKRDSIHHSVCKLVEEIVSVHCLYELVIHSLHNYPNKTTLQDFYHECVEETVGDDNPIMIKENNTATIRWQGNKNKHTLHLFVNEAGLLSSEGVHRLTLKNKPMKSVHYLVTKKRASYFFRKTFSL